MICYILRPKSGQPISSRDKEISQKSLINIVKRHIGHVAEQYSHIKVALSNMLLMKFDFNWPDF